MKIQRRIIVSKEHPLDIARSRVRFLDEDGGQDADAPVGLPPPPPPSPGQDRKTVQPGPGGPGLPAPGGPRMLFSWLALAVLCGMMIYSLRNGSKGPGRELENDGVFRGLVEAGRVEKCEIVRENGGKTYIKGVRKGGEEDEGGIPKNFTLSVAPDTNGLQDYLRANSIPFAVKYANPFFGDLMVQVIPILIFVGLMAWLFSRQMKGAGGPFSFAKSRAKKMEAGTRKVTFENVAGIEEAKEEVQEIIEFLKDPKKFAALGGRIPKGVLLMGPPGTGKTLLARAIAGEAGVPFFSISGSDFDEMFVGVGASRVRDLFEQGKKNAPCIIFIDEIDAVGRSRGATGGLGGRHDDQTINALLVEMDGFEASEGVILVAATNRPDVLDKALVRPGRFDRQIVIDLPTLEGRKEILSLHAKKLKMAPDADIERIARGTPGFSGADLANLLNEAALLAARLGKDAIGTADMEEARDKVAWGRERRGNMADAEEKHSTAVHEAGHAIVMSLVKGGEPIHKVTIIPRGMALGATMYLPRKEHHQFTRTQMLAQLATCMGGRAAEAIFLDDISSGARQDIKAATTLAQNMVCDWGMSDKLGPRAYSPDDEARFFDRRGDYSEATAQAIDSEIDALLRDAYKTAYDILSSRKAEMDILVAELLDKETVDGSVVEEIVTHGRILTDVERHAADAPPSETPAAEAASDATPEAVS